MAESLHWVVRALTGSTPRTLSAVFEDWEGIAGERLARHVRPLRLAGGVLVVGADRPAWASEVRLLASELLTRIAEATGERPDRIDVVVEAQGAPSKRFGKRQGRVQ